MVMAYKPSFQPPTRSAHSNGPVIRSQYSKSLSSINSSGCDADGSSSSSESSPHWSPPKPIFSSTARESAVSDVRGRQARLRSSVGHSIPTTIEDSNMMNFSPRRTLDVVSESPSVELIDISNENDEGVACRRVPSGVHRFAKALSSSSKTDPGKEPLESVVAVVDTWSGSNNIGSSVKSVLERLGATVRTRISKEVTHAVFSEGRRLKLDDLRKRPGLHLVSLLWVEQCMKLNTRASEAKFAAVEKKREEESPFQMLSQKKKGSQKERGGIDLCRPTDQPASTIEKIKKREKRALKAKIKKHVKNINPLTPGNTPKMSKSLMRAINRENMGHYFEETDTDNEEESGEVIDVDEIMQPVKQLSSSQRDEMNALRRKLDKLDEGASNCPETPLAQIVFERMFSGPNAKYKGSPVPDFLLSQVSKPDPSKGVELDNEGDQASVPESSDVDTSSVSVGSVHLVRRRSVAHRTVGVNTSHPAPRRQSTRIDKNKPANMVVACSQTTPGLDELGAERRLNNIDQIIEEVCAMAISNTPKVLTAPKTKRLKIGCKKVNASSKATTNRQKAAKEVKLSRREMKHMFDSGDEMNSSAFRPIVTKSTALNAILNRPSDEDFYPKNVLPSRMLKKQKKPDNILVVLQSDLGVNEVAEAAVERFGDMSVGRRVMQETTHVIVTITKESVMAVDTLLAIAAGAYMLPPEWLYRSIEAGEWLPESEFELKDAFPAAVARRLEGRGSSLLSDVGLIYVSKDCSLPYGDVLKLVRLSGGKVTSSRLRASVMVSDVDSPSPSNAPLFPTSWLCKCIEKNSLVDRRSNV